MGKNGRNPGDNPGALVTQPHGGALKRGGTNPGAGRPSNELRGSLREILGAGLPHLREFAAGERVTKVSVTCPECKHGFSEEVLAARPSDQLKALELSARHGLTKDGYDKELIAELWAAIEQAFNTSLANDEAAKLAVSVKAAWMPILAQRLVDAL